METHCLICKKDSKKRTLNLQELSFIFHSFNFPYNIKLNRSQLNVGTK